jgi:hypothetical protein
MRDGKTAGAVATSLTLMLTLIRTASTLIQMRRTLTDGGAHAQAMVLVPHGSRVSSRVRIGIKRGALGGCVGPSGVF